jgi:Outer membrane protein beta-barrel domain
MTFKACSVAVALAAGLFAASDAAAQGAPQEEGAVELTVAPRSAPIARRSGPVGPLRFFGGFRLGVGGQFVNMDGPGNFDAKATPGLQAGVDYVVMDYFAIGGETRLNWVKDEDQDDRTMLWDLVVKPRGRYQFNNLPLELYGTLPVGLSVANYPNDTVVEVDGGAGATVGLLGGANYFFTDHMGINAELGAMFHWIHGSVDRFGGSTDLKYRLAQCSLLQVNFVYAL